MCNFLPLLYVKHYICGNVLHTKTILTSDARLSLTYASPAPKANVDLVNATFMMCYTNEKNGSALGVSVYVIVMP